MSLAYIIESMRSNLLIVKPLEEWWYANNDESWMDDDGQREKNIERDGGASLTRSSWKFASERGRDLGHLMMHCTALSRDHLSYFHITGVRA